MKRLQILAPLLVVSLCIAVAITGLITYLNTGWTAHFLARWAHAAMLAWCVMLPIGGAAMAGLSRAADRLLAERPVWLRRLALGLLMGLTMETVASAIATGSNVGVGPGFVESWRAAFVRAVPLGLAIGLLMSFVVGPWIGRRAARLLRGEHAAGAQQVDPRPSSARR